MFVVYGAVPYTRSFLLCCAVLSGIGAQQQPFGHAASFCNCFKRPQQAAAVLHTPAGTAALHEHIDAPAAP